MFKAVKHGKVRFSDNVVATTWDQVFKLNEDFLTAAVFSRLVYLTPEAIAAVLPELGRDVGEVQEAVFWPNWAVSTRRAGAGAAQPDILLRFDNFNVIVEAKLGDSARRQVARQWARYWAAGHQGDHLGPGRPAMLLGVGGLGDEAQAEASVLEAKANAYLRMHFPNLAPMRAAGVSWRSLYDRLRNLEAGTGTAEAPVRALLQDLMEILGYYGFRPFLSLADLPEAATKGNAGKITQAAFDTLVGWQHDWLAMSHGLRPIADSSIQVFAEIEYGKSEGT